MLALIYIPTATNHDADAQRLGLKGAWCPEILCDHCKKPCGISKRRYGSAVAAFDPMRPSSEIIVPLHFHKSCLKQADPELYKHELNQHMKSLQGNATAQRWLARLANSRAKARRARKAGTQ